MKTKEELNALKEEVETLNKKLHELTEEELAQVKGGSAVDICLFIEIGDEHRAKRLYCNEKYELTDSERKRIWFLFYEKFGYAIE